MTVAFRPSVRLLVLVPALVAIGSVVLDFVLLEYFGAFLLPVLGLLVYVGVGLLLTLRLPRQPVGWLLLWAGALFQLSLGATAYAWAAFIRAPGTLPLGEVALLIALAWIPAFGCLSLAITLFPTGRPPSPRWQLPLALVVIVNALMLAALLTTPEFQVPQTVTGGRGLASVTVRNPIAVDGTLATVLGYAAPLNLVMLLTPLAAVLVRFRTAAGTERQQLKWFAYASSITMLFFVATVFGVFSYLAGLGPLIAVVALDLVPISVAIAILRYRLYDIDVLINRTLVYGSLSATLLGTYLLSVLGLSAVLRPLAGSSDLAVAGSTLLVVALFQPFRSRIQRFVDRRFYRSRYDAARTLDAFGLRLRDEVDLDSVRADLLDVVHATVRPAHARVWLRNDLRTPRA